MLSESKLYDYDAIVEQYANDKWSLKPKTEFQNFDNLVRKDFFQ